MNICHACSVRCNVLGLCCSGIESCALDQPLLNVLDLILLYEKGIVVEQLNDG